MREMSGFMEYARNCLWLIFPPLAILAIVSPLPPAYRSDLYWDDVPLWISLGENLTRIVVVTLPAFMSLRMASRRQHIGLALYLFGLAAYWAAWRSQIVWAGSAWVAHPVAFMAPAWTPLFWLAGIALIGDRFYFRAPYRPWMYLAVSLLFLLFHNLHAWIVWSRVRP